ncbi:glycoside hydrolase family 30 protein [Rhizoctonia solani AG-1 IA]|uniref:pyridoxal kinase n=1 Tax=Thanatephorus cucumeris (strain AG1-IA) TaxID=983506 RepID=L8WNN3_THACA|nr:glycoside hydrolase family 30 protein [Rhizoctonia solani AG-1 IA]
MRLIFLAVASGLLHLSAAQTIYDIWQTTWDRSKLLTRTSDPLVNFVTKGAIGDANIVVNDGTVYQQMDGFGATLITDGAATAGFGVLRLNLGASDFSAKGKYGNSTSGDDLQGIIEIAYSFDDKSGDTTLSSFSLDNAPSYLWSVLKDIYSINPKIKLYVLPWSPPAWMKSGGTMSGGELQAQYNDAQYLFKTVQQLSARGFPVYAINPQNEPQNSNPTYPTTKMSASQEAAIGQALRPLLNNNGFSSVKIIGFEHNWDNAGGYPIDLLETFHNAYPNKEIYFTECTGSFGSDWWSDIKWTMDNTAIGAPQHWARTALEWNFASDESGGPTFPGTDSCKSPACRAIVTVKSDGSYELNQEFYSLAQASRAIVPKDPGGPIGQRIGVTVGGNLSWALRVNAFVTKRSNSADWNRYSIVVLNWNDNSSSSWNPQPVKATIEFRGVQTMENGRSCLSTNTVYATSRDSNQTSFRYDSALVVGGVAAKLSRELQLPRSLGYGSYKESNKAATFPLQLLGWDVDAINTVQFSNHSGYRSHGGSKTDKAQLIDIFTILEKNEFTQTDALLSDAGYVPGAEALSALADFATHLKAKNPNLLFVLDPVMGDDGKMYVANDVLPVYRDRLLPLATVITPNWFEVELMTQIHLASQDSIRSALRSLHFDHGVRNVVVTSVIVREGSRLSDEVTAAGLRAGSSYSSDGLTNSIDLNDEYILCIASSAHDDPSIAPAVYALAVPRIKGYFSGVGDLFSALVMAHFHQAQHSNTSSLSLTAGSMSSLSSAASRALHTTHAVLRRTQQHALTLAAQSSDDPSSSNAYTDDELDSKEPLRRVRRMRTRELRIIQSRDDILAFEAENGSVENMRAWEGFWGN